MNFVTIDFAGSLLDDNDSIDLNEGGNLDENSN